LRTNLFIRKFVRQPVQERCISKVGVHRIGCVWGPPGRLHSARPRVPLTRPIWEPRLSRRRRLSPRSGRPPLSVRANPRTGDEQLGCVLAGGPCRGEPRVVAAKAVAAISAVAPGSRRPVHGDGVPRAGVVMIDGPRPKGKAGTVTPGAGDDSRRVMPSPPAGYRPGTSWKTQPLPSGSLNDARERFARRAGSGPGTRSLSPMWWNTPPASWNTSLTSTPRETSSS
jgi:hypothetical protein